MPSTSSTDKAEKPSHFIRDIVLKDIKNNKNNGRVMTRFPPEPNGYLHIGHAKAICISYELAEEFNGIGKGYNLRFDDTNPTNEEVKYVDSIINDIRWLGYDWGDRLFFASDYFDQLYEYAIKLIKDSKAYVDDLTADEVKAYRGTLTEPGKESPYRNRSVEENLDLFERMKNGEFTDGAKILRAKIDMASPNLNMRDPTLYRIKHESHYRTGDTWCIYPLYDWTHGQSDSIEGITHSLCSLEFENHRPLYNWFLDQLDIHHPQQIEFARLNINYTITSKRKLLKLVEEGYVSGWDDPRMPTLSGMRRRGYPPMAIRNFCNLRTGVTKNRTVIDVSVLETSIREDLNEHTPRVMAVLRPLKIVIENYPEDLVEDVEAANHPTNPDMGKRTVPFSRELYIEQGDFMEDPPKKFYRLAPDREVRLRYGYYIKCTEVIKDESGKVVELRCTYDPETRGGYAPDGRKVKATLHWVSAKHAIKAEARLYDRLFAKAEPDKKNFLNDLNPNSLETLICFAEPSLANAEPEARYQFERLGYFCVDNVDSTPENLVFNRTTTLRDLWARIQKKKLAKK